MKYGTRTSEHVAGEALVLDGLVTADVFDQARQLLRLDEREGGLRAQRSQHALVVRAKRTRCVVVQNRQHLMAKARKVIEPSKNVNKKK